MCGIAGFYGFKNDGLIKKISKEMEHRGPDGEGYFIDDTVTLLSRRLAIIDRKGGDQPIYNEDKSIVVVYNGEIYNYLELRNELEKSGHTFKTKSDTEVIVHGYEEWGDEAFDRYNGMFGAALYDMKRKRLLLARDHFGIKPLYYLLTQTTDSFKNFTFETCLLFASEIKPIIQSGLVQRKPNDRIIYRYLKYRIHDDSEETFFEGVHKLMPGEMMVIEKGKVKKKYFSKLKENLLKSVSSKTSVNNVEIQKFRDELIKSVTMRLVSEVPVGTALSGGIDSSTVVAIVNKLLKEKVKETESVGKIQQTFSAVFPGSSNDEEKYVDDLVNMLEKNLNCHKVYPKPEEFFQDLEDFVRTQEEPTISTGPYAQYKVMQEAHNYVTVMLDGQGSDEMMAGYLPYYFVYLRQLYQEKKYGTLLTESAHSFDVISKFLIQKVKQKLGLSKKLSVNSILNSQFSKKYEKESFKVNNNNLKERLVEDIFYNSLPSLLRYEDKNTMRFSIEGRVPFLDFNLLKYLFTLNDEAIIKDGWNKYILREAVKNLLPASIDKRRNKIGFTTPEHEWFMRMKNRIYSIFMSESFINRPYFNQPEVIKAFQQFIEGKTTDTMFYWRLLNLELWLREFFDEKKVSNELKTDLPKRKDDFGPNKGKKLEIKVDGKEFKRFPVQTELFAKGDNVEEKITNNVKRFFIQSKKYEDQKWFVVISEKVVAISQGRSFFIWDIKPGFWAQLLSKYVKRTPFGIGLGSPWTMQIAINEVGLPRILFASIASAVTKPLGMKGTFYKIVGRTVASIDGPTEYSLYPSNVSAKLGPKDPQKVVEQIHEHIKKTFSKEQLKGFQGVVIIDANDLGRDILGNSTTLNNELIAKIFKDNPMGQSNEQTPLVIVFES